MNQAGRNEKIVSLSQTEIMLVLAVVILLLLLLQSESLRNVCDKLTDDKCSSVFQELQESEPPRPLPDGFEKPNQNGISPDEEFNKPLDSEGGGGSSEVPPLSPESSPDTPENESDDREIPEIEETVFETLGIEKEADADSVRLTLENLQQQAQDAEEMRTENEKLEKENSELRASLAAELPTGDTDAARNLKNKIGCLPCWLGDGKRLYYFAYNIRHSGGRYHISPHRDLQSNAAVVNKALDGGLRVIKEYPRKPVGREDFLAFARKIAAAQKRLYGDNGCRLAITINEEVRGTTIKFLRDNAGFCPILP